MIRRLVPADAVLFRRLRLAALAEAPHAFGSTLAREQDLPVEHFAGRVEGSVVLAAFLGEEAVGVAGLRQEDGPRERHKAVLWGLHVAPRARRRGVAAALIDAVLAAAPDDVEQVLLTVTSGNAGALALYEGAGFRRYGVEPRALKDGSVYADEVLMVKGRTEALLF